MKFPNKLSKERISLLSEKDKLIYEYEHSGLYSNKLNNKTVLSNISEKLFNSEFDSIFDKELIEMVGIKEYNNIKKQIYNYIQNDPELQVLNEAQGEPADYWIPSLGWLGKLTAGLLTGLLGVIAWLFMKGMDRLALKKLKLYMNKLVELVDLGVHKKKPWYAFLIPGSKNTGEYSKACLRSILETAERNMACLYTLCVHDLGFLDPDISNFKDISGIVPSENSGLGNFNNIVKSISKELYGIDNLNIKNNKEQMLPFLIDDTLFENLKLPATPTNYNMLMSNIDYPDKAKKNPNGSLFMKPTEEILNAHGSDIGLSYFNKNVNVKSIITYAKRQNNLGQNESYNYLGQYDKIYELFGIDILSNDLDTNIAGKEINQETLKKEITNVKQFKGKITSAIDGYCRSSIPIINKLIKAICGGKGADFKAIGELNELITHLLNAANGNMSKFIKRTDSVLKEITDNNYTKTIKEYSNKLNVMRLITLILRIIQNETAFRILTRVGERKISEINKKLQEIQNDETVTNEKECKRKLKDIFNWTDDNINKAIEEFNKSNASDTSSGPINNSLLFNYINNYQLFEDEDRINDDAVKSDNKVLLELQETVLNVYNDTVNNVSEKMSLIVNADTDSWYIITNARERMVKLKEAADKEIELKIELICRTAANGNNDLGDKFKSAISKHPLRAESLKRIWSMYSDDLNDRIESRIRSITGGNGNSNILDTINLFLTTTYPNLLGLLIQYKSILYCVELYTKLHPITSTREEVILQVKQNELKTKVELEVAEVITQNSNNTPNN